MIELYTWGTPNGKKISIMLEELKLPYEVFPINIGEGDQFKPKFLKVNPNSKIPAIVDKENKSKPVTIFESAAILIYLAEKTGKLLPAKGAARYTTLSWLSWQIGGVGPMFGQLGHFLMYADENIPYAIKRYETESVRLLEVLNKQLSNNKFMAGNRYSIADIATYPWVLPYVQAMKEMNPDIAKKLTKVTKWLNTISERPAVKKGMQIP